MDAERAALAELAERTAQERLDAEEVLRLREEQFERENMQRHQDAVELSNRLISEANQKAAEISARAQEIAQESEALLSSSHAKADEIMSDARRLAASLLDQAQLRANSLGDKTRKQLEGLLERTMARMEALREERELLDEFVSDISEARSTDMLIAEFEERFRAEVEVEEPNS